ncbi:ORF064 [Saltwater crocodilepox virus]|nr:ORF064 [Saltwater crocodilepox virus]
MLRLIRDHVFGAAPVAPRHAAAARATLAADGRARALDALGEEASSYLEALLRETSRDDAGHDASGALAAFAERLPAALAAAAALFPLLRREEVLRVLRGRARRLLFRAETLAATTAVLASSATDDEFVAAYRRLCAFAGGDDDLERLNAHVCHRLLDAPGALETLRRWCFLRAAQPDLYSDLAARLRASLKGGAEPLFCGETPRFAAETAGVFYLLYEAAPRRATELLARQREREGREFRAALADAADDAVRADGDLPSGFFESALGGRADADFARAHRARLLTRVLTRPDHSLRRAENRCLEALRVALPFADYLFCLGAANAAVKSGDSISVPASYCPVVSTEAARAARAADSGRASASPPRAARRSRVTLMFGYAELEAVFGERSYALVCNSLQMLVLIRAAIRRLDLEELAADLACDLKLLKFNVRCIVNAGLLHASRNAVSLNRSFSSPTPRLDFLDGCRPRLRARRPRHGP